MSGCAVRHEAEALGRELVGNMLELGAREPAAVGRDDRVGLAQVVQYTRVREAGHKAVESTREDERRSRPCDARRVPIREREHLLWTKCHTDFLAVSSGRRRAQS